MKKIIQNHEALIQKVQTEIPLIADGEMAHKSSAENWSKKEILGHLIDSAQINLDRFKVVLNSDKPYEVKSYNPDDLVRERNYQNSHVQDLLTLWLSINWQIEKLLGRMHSQQMRKEVILDTGETAEFQFLIEDYVKHVDHHLKQILSK